MEIVRGLVVRAAAGRDKGGFFTVLSAENGYAVICDGKRRGLSHPKRKNEKHLFPTAVVLDEGSLQTNRKIRKALAAVRGEADPENGGF